MRRAVLAAGILAAFLVPVAPYATAETCARTAMPYGGVAGASLVPTDYVSKDSPPVRYTRWRGTVPGFDGMPFSVDVTVPCGVSGRQPLVVMAHGFTDDKTIWEETDRSNKVTSDFRPASNSHWNNIWFASRGYVVVNYTARGWHDSCGPDTPGATRVAPAPQCQAYQYWIHLDDKRWEVRDAQWLAGALVQSGLADPSRMAITGGSYGGGPPSMGGLLGSRVMCGGAAVPAALGVDACKGKTDGELADWTTPDGTTKLRWAVAIPMYTFADLIQVLAPNGRGSDGDNGVPDGDHTNPFGIPIQTTVAGLLAAGEASGFFAPPGRDPTADIVTDAARLLAGNPFPQQDPLVARGVDVYRRFKSPITVDPVDRVPMFWVHGLTDALFPALEPLVVYKRLKALDPNYPVKLFLGDLGHDYAAERQDEWDLAHVQMNDFIDHYLRPDRTPRPPVFDVGATVTRCLDHDAPMRFESAPTWTALHPTAVTFSAEPGGASDSATPGRAGLATDPITTATLSTPGAYKGCRVMRPAETDPAAVTSEFALPNDLVLMGAPVIHVHYATTAPDTEINVRMWDVAADRSVQGLVTRGTYRSVDGPGDGLDARFELMPQGYRFPAGHTLKVEVTANDETYRQRSNVPAVVRVEAVDVAMPRLRGTESTGSRPSSAAATPAPGVQGRSASGRLPATGGAVSPAPALAVMAFAMLLAARRRAAPGRGDRTPV